MPQETKVDTAIWLPLERQPYELHAYLNREVLCRVGQAGGNFSSAVSPGAMADCGIHAQVDTEVSAEDPVVCSESSLVDPGQNTSRVRGTEQNGRPGQETQGPNRRRMGVGG